MATAPYFTNGKWWIDKDPDDQLFYYADVSTHLTDSGTTAISVTAIVAGVEILTPAVNQGAIMAVKLGGLDLADGAENFCTFRITCANTEQFDKTIWFKRQEN